MGAEVKWEGRGKGLFVHCVYSEAQQRVRSTGAIIKERGEYAVRVLSASFFFLDAHFSLQIMEWSNFLIHRREKSQDMQISNLC